MPSDAVQVGAPLIAEPTDFDVQFLEALRKMKAEVDAREAERAAAQHAAPPPSASVEAARMEVPDLPTLVEAALVDTQSIDELAGIGLQMFAAMMELVAHPGEAAHDTAAVSTAPAGRPEGVPPHIAALDRALEHVQSEDEAMAVVEAFADAKVAEIAASSNPLEALICVLGTEAVTAVLEVVPATVADLEAEGAAAGGPITDQAAGRIARKMVRRIIRRADRADRAMRRPPRGRDVRRVRVLRMPRARRAPHRRAVRLSAVASAGDGPSPPGPPPAVRGGRGYACLARLHCGLAGDVLPASEVRR